MNDDPIKLILFTSDESPRTRQSALASGADAVVVKSPDASEIIHTVSNFLKM
jgi:DNA-binding NarL/FixJ family response regulator